jgi:Malectin domain
VSVQRRSLLVVLAGLSFLATHAWAAEGDQVTGNANTRGPKIVYRVNCGSDKAYTDTNGNVWLADQALADGKAWGVAGGGAIGRAIQTIPGTPSPGVYRAERYGKCRYEFNAPAGAYTVRLHFAETFYSNFKPGDRVFDVSVNGKIAKGIDTIKDGGGFSRPSVRRLSGIAPEDGKITVRLSKGLINGIEVFQHDQADAPKVRRILFIGNSYTGFWDLPDSIARMVNTGEHGFTVECDRSIMPGRGLADHWARGQAAKVIKTGNYDFVVLQGYGDWAPDKYPKTLELLRSFNEVIRAGGGRTLLYCTWARSSSVTESARQQKQIAETVQRLAAAVDGVMIPAGPAWQAGREQDGDLDIEYFADKTCHPTLYSAYLSACVFTAALTGQSPQGHPLAVIGEQRQAIEPKIAAFLQRIAWDTVKAQKLEKALLAE